jgi:hypothetical protein
MKIAKLTAIVLIMGLFAALILSCGNSTVDPGTISGNTFTEDFFGLELTIPDGFIIGSQGVSEDETLIFFDASEPETDDSDYLEMSISVLAEKLSLGENVVFRDEESYLNHVQGLLIEGSEGMFEYDFSALTTTTIGGKTFSKLASSADLFGVFVMKQDFYTHKQGNHLLSFVVSYDGDAAHHATIIDEFFRNAKFN